jgi:Icc protein
MNPSCTTVLQLTDLHLFAGPEGRFKGVDTRETFGQVLSHVRNHYSRPDLILLTGDLAHDGREDTYRLIAERLAPFDAPAYCVFGNHDRPDQARRVYPLPPVRTEGHTIAGSWLLVLLDSNHDPEPGAYEGEVGPDELRRLAELAADHPDRHLLIAMHHNLPEHDDRGVAHEIRNHREVMAHFEGLPNLRVVLSGHVHQEFAIVQNGVGYFSTPSTGYQSLSKAGRVTGEAPGYRWLKLYANGRVETDVRRINTVP